MSLTDWVEVAGGPGLAAAAFVGATLVPISSEVAFVTALRLGMAAPSALAWATLGNSLGCALNVALGWWARERVGPRLSDSRGGRAALRLSDRYGAWALLLSWAPVVGDPLTVVAGVARVRPWLAALIVVPLRFARYVALVPLG